MHLFTNRDNAKRHVGLKIQVAQDEQVSLAFLVHTCGLQHFICHPCCFMKVQNFFHIDQGGAQSVLELLILQLG